MASDVLLGGVAAVLGGALTVGGQWVQTRRQQQHDITQDLRRARREAHQELLREAHLAGHYVARMTDGHPSPLNRTPENLARIDAEVMPRIWQVKMLSESTQAEVEEFMLSLYDWRKVTLQPGARFEDAEYASALLRFRAARQAYTDAARRELLADNKRPR